MNCRNNDIDMSVCNRNINLFPMLQSYNTMLLAPNINNCKKKNILLQQMVSCEDCKYVINWDFDLDGKTITVPERCILEFDGGSLSNGTIIGQNTLINNIGNLDNIFRDNVNKQGTWVDHFAGGGGGQPGPAGKDGTTFTPSVSSQGIISWTNDGGKPNPTPVNIKGPQGASGVGVPTGGTAGQVLKKKTNTDFDTEWGDEEGGGGESSLLWRPTVDANGNISWNKSSSSVAPATQNIKGQQGNPGTPGQNGQDGITPHIDPTSKHWMIGSTDTGIVAEGQNGTNGKNGVTPHIDSTTGNWFIGDTNTGVHAQGPQGNPGQNGTNGTNGVGVPAGGSTGQVLKKKSGTDYDTEWANESGGGGGDLPWNKVYLDENGGVISSEMLTETDVVYVICYDYTLSGTLTIPSGCALEFQGGSITGGTIANLYAVISEDDACVFNGVTFANSPVTLRLDWLMPHKGTSMSDTTDVTSQLSAAFNCGVKRIDVTSKYYYYITQTVTITQADLDIVGNTEFSTNAGNRTTSYMGSCIHTDQPITMIDFVVNVDPVGKTRKSLTIDGLRLYMHYDYTDVDYSTLASYKSLPLLLIENGNAGIHKEYINVYIQGRDCRPKHTLDGGYYSKFNAPLFTGIEFRPTSSNMQTFIHVKGIISAVYCGVRAMYQGAGAGGWLTDLDMGFDSTALVYGLVTDVGPVKFGGCHQPMTCRLEKDNTDGFIQVGNRDGVTVAITGTIWDLNASTTKTRYNSNDVEDGTVDVYNPVHAATGKIISFVSDNFYYTYYGTDGLNIPENIQSPMVPFMEEVAMSHNYLAFNYADYIPSSESNVFALAHSAGPDNLGNVIYKPVVSNVTITDDNSVTYTETDVFTSGSIECLFLPKIQSLHGSGDKNETWPKLKQQFTANLTISFSVSGTKNAWYTLMRSIVFAVGNKDARVSATVVFDDNSTVSLGQTTNATKGYLIKNLIDFERLGYSLSRIDFVVTIAKKTTYLPWIGIMGTGISSAFSGGGYLGGVTTIQNAVLKQSESGYRYKYLPNGKFTDVYITSTSYTKILEFTYLKTGSHLVVRYEGAESEVFLDINPSNSTANVAKAVGVKVKYEIHSTGMNTSTKTLVLYAKKIDGDAYLSAKEISTAFNHLVRFENLSNGTIDANGEFGYKTSGTFTEKPSSSEVPVGFKYFCTDKQTTEGATNGIEIIHKGSDVWVDALGRTVS